MTCEKKLRDVAERLSSRFLGVEPSDHHKAECCSKDDEIADLKRKLGEFKHGQDAYQRMFYESQARESRLREALSLVDGLIKYQYTGSREAMSALQDVAFAVSDTLALPHDDTALKEYRESEYVKVVRTLEEAKTKSRNSLFRSGIEIAIGEVITLKGQPDETRI